MTPYEGCTLSGVVHQTWLRGHKIWDSENDGHQGSPTGIMLLEERMW
jgi:dihydroorotase-like cyclic amidohydrolase